MIKQCVAIIYNTIIMTEGTKQQHTTNKEIKKYKIKHKTINVKNYSLEIII